MPAPNPEYSEITLNSRNSGPTSGSDKIVLSPTTTDDILGLGGSDRFVFGPSAPASPYDLADFQSRNEGNDQLDLSSVFRKVHHAHGETHRHHHKITDENIGDYIKIDKDGKLFIDTTGEGEFDDDPWAILNDVAGEEVRVKLKSFKGYVTAESGDDNLLPGRIFITGDNGGEAWFDENDNGELDDNDVQVGAQDDGWSWESGIDLSEASYTVEFIGAPLDAPVDLSGFDDDDNLVVNLSEGLDLPDFPSEVYAKFNTTYTSSKMFGLTRLYQGAFPGCFLSLGFLQFGTTGKLRLYTYSTNSQSYLYSSKNLATWVGTTISQSQFSIVWPELSPP